MLLRQMFPSPYLQAEDLRAMNPGPTVVTIEEINFKTRQGEDVGKAEIDYFIRFREFKKWARLKPAMCSDIESALGSEETDEWIGQTISIYPTTVQVPAGQGKKKTVWVIGVEPNRPVTPPQLKPGTDITGLAAEHRRRTSPIMQQPAGMIQQPSPAPGVYLTGKPIGKRVAAVMILTLRERGWDWDRLIGHMKRLGLETAIAGRMPFDADESIMVPARALAASLPKVAPIGIGDLDAEVAKVMMQWEPPASPAPASPLHAATQTTITQIPGGAVAGEVVDRVTGVVTPADPSMSFKPSKAPAPVVNDDDIPF